MCNIVICYDGIEPMGWKWIYFVKLEYNSSFALSKARLVAFESMQGYGINYEETIALIVKMTTVWIILAVFISQLWSLF